MHIYSACQCCIFTLRGEALQNHLPHLAYSHSNSRTRAFLDSTDRKWIYAEYNMTAQQKFKIVHSANNTRTLWIDWYKIRPTLVFAGQYLLREKAMPILPTLKSLQNIFPPLIPVITFYSQYSFLRSPFSHFLFPSPSSTPPPPVCGGRYFILSRIGIKVQGACFTMNEMNDKFCSIVDHRECPYSVSWPRGRGNIFFFKGTLTQMRFSQMWYCIWWRICDAGLSKSVYSKHQTLNSQLSIVSKGSSTYILQGTTLTDSHLYSMAASATL